MLVEKDVENRYRAKISAVRPAATWSSPYGTDGFATWHSAPTTVRLLLEAKYDLNLKSRAVACGVLGQVLLYLKRFEAAGETLPNVLLVGDKDECFILSTDSVKGFLSLPLDWSVAPSKGSPELTRALVDGVNILPYILEVDEHFSFKDLVERIEILAAGKQVSVRASETNLGAIFIYWRDRVFRPGKGKHLLTATEQVDVFLRSLFAPDNIYLHPTQRGRLMVPGYPEGVLVDTDQYRAFFAQYEQGYKPSEVSRFMAMKDRLVEDDARRRQGAFFTPSLWVEEAHREISRVLGDDWRQNSVVWDCAAGTGNLTRDHHDWGCLISSTAERPDANAMRDHGWGGASVFQYDFLNPDEASPFFEEGERNTIPLSVDKILRQNVAAGKRLVFFMNPPYGTAAVGGTTGTSKAGIAMTTINKEMKAAKLGAPSQQLYAQFMFRCRKLAEQYGYKTYTIAQFSPCTFMASGSYKPFRDWWYNGVAYQGGLLFQASHFADVSGRWGVSFTVWNSGGKTDNQAVLPIRLCDEERFTITTTDIKQMYNSDGREASEWVREPIKKLKGVDGPQMSSGLKVVRDMSVNIYTDQLCTLLNDGNNLQASGTNVAFLPPPGKKGNNERVPVFASNWRRAVALYAARKLVQGNWINDKDEYLAPSAETEASDTYNQWVNDCHLYAILHTGNNCTAMRDVTYKGKSWRIKNHWFWRTRQDTLHALDTIKTGLVYRDCQQEPVKRPSINPITGMADTQPWEHAGDAYMAHLLNGNQFPLSPDASRVLHLLNALWLKSLPMRDGYYADRRITEDEPDLHLNAWDAGIYQLKHLFRTLYADDWAELKSAHKILSDRLQEGVYTFGFLKR